MRSYKQWCDKLQLNELFSLSEKEIDDAFYRELEFGTGGLRGVLGLGNNRMNIYTVRKASQGLANYINKNYQNPSIAISRDSRLMSLEFAQEAAKVFVANGIKVYFYKDIMPTPCLSHAVRYLKCSAGIMVTASHNPSKYNGYKVYNDKGCQITTEAANAIQQEINNVDIFDDVKLGDFEVEYINENVYTDFIENIKKTSVINEKINRNISIIYTPLNGTGLKPVTRILKETGFNNVIVVKEQEQPDGNFPTCPFPNPEIREAMAKGIEYAKKYNADLLMATDPDCDRVGIAVKDGDDFVLLTGNETGLLLLDFICNQRIKNQNMPKTPLLVKTIVSSDLAEIVAKYYGVRTINVLTGFKFIGEQIDKYPDDFIFGFEESYGYLSGKHARDKDAVNACFLIAEMFAYYQNQGISLINKLREIYNKFGYCLNTLYSFQYEGKRGFFTMQELMKNLRENGRELLPFGIDEIKDYSLGIDDLPKSDVLKYYLIENCSIVVRPSGTEPKLKLYISVTGKDKITCQEKETKIAEIFHKILKKAD